MSDVRLTWYKSSQCSANACLEVARLSASELALRNSSDSGGSLLRVTREEFLSFLRAAKAGEFDVLID
jgi:hypothetical protein